MCMNFVTVLVQTPGADKRQSTPLAIDSWVKVTALPGHLTFVSFPFLELFDITGSCRYKRVELYQGHNTSDNLIWSGCNTDGPTPRTYDADFFTVRLRHSTRTNRLAGEGFQIRFSFHEVSEVR